MDKYSVKVHALGLPWCRCGVLALALAGCGQHDDSAPPLPTGDGTTISPSKGGEINGPDGIKLIVAADTIDTAVTFRIVRDATDAPELLGLHAVSPIYAITPHGQTFDGSARVSIPVSAATRLPAGATPLLLKAEQGDNWRVLENISTDPTRLVADIDGLSFFVLGSCTSTSSEWTLGAVDCPGTDHQLQLTLYDEDGAPVLRGTGVNVLLWEVIDTPQTLHFNAFWRRPEGTNRTDQLSVSGLPGGFNSTGFRSTWTNEVIDIDPSFASYGKPFSVTIDPGKVPGAGAANGTILRVRTQASYQTTALRVGQGDVPVGFTFEAEIPILVRSTGSLPFITQQPADAEVSKDQPATFVVQASITPAATLSYQWSRRADSAGIFSSIAGATAPTYTLGAAKLGDDGAQFRVRVCASSTRCVDSNPATLKVSENAVAPTFTQQPASVYFLVGENASFSVAATGSPLPSIHWESAPASDPTNFGPFTGTSCGTTNPPASGTSTSTTCTFGPLTAADDGRRFRAVATNTSGPGIPSDPAVLTKTEQPTITVVPSSQTVDNGQSATFTVEATGANLTYQWKRARRILPNHYPLFSDIPGAVSNTYITPPATIADDQMYFAVLVCSGPTLPSTKNCVIVTASEPFTYEPIKLSVKGIVSQHFAVVSSGTTASLHAVAFASASVGVAVGDSGTVLRTTDGGQNWTPVTSGTTLELRAVSLNGAGKGVAVGPDILLYTDDNGATWTATDMSSSECCVDVAYAGASTALVARGGGGLWSGFFRSSDGGESFNEMVGADISYTTAVRFGSATVGAAANGGIYYTSDAGASWTEATRPPEIATYELAFASSSIAVGSNSSAHILRSTDGAQTWTVLYDGGYTRPSNALAFNSAGVGLSVGEGAYYAMMRTNDSGATWVALELPGHEDPALIMHGIAFADANVAIAVGYEGKILRFTASGL